MDTSCFRPTVSGLITLAAALMLGACSSLPRAPIDGASAEKTGATFKQVQRPAPAPLASKEELALLEESLDPVYRIGSGDVLRLDVFGRPEVSGKHVVGPDGRITVALVGDVRVDEMTREQAVRALDERLSVYFTRPQLTLAVEEYTSNQVTVLGRVERAGIHKFTHSPTLAEVLAISGAMPGADKQSALTRSAIMRGRDKLIWVDIKALLSGDAAYNFRMKKGDIVFIPDSSETSVYVLGAVNRAGPYRLSSRMTVLDAIAQAGGPNENAATGKIGVYRAGARQVEIIDFSDLIDPSRKMNYALEDGDVVFVPTTGLADFGYVMRQIAPAVSVLTFGMTLNALKP